MGKHEIDAGYYEDDGYDEDWALGNPSLKSRFYAVLGTSWGSSIAIHLAILAILATIIVATPAQQERAVLLVKKPPVVETPPDPLLEPDEIDMPELEPVDVVVDPTLIEPDEVIPEPPEGESLDNLTTKDLRSDSIDDAYGLSGAPAGKKGLRGNKGAAAKYGYDKASKNALDAALRWLARHQAPQGHWAHAYARHCPRGEAGPCGEGLGASREFGLQQHHEVGLTGLALLAFMGDGSTHMVGKWKRTVRKGFNWLRAQQGPDGSIGFKGGETMYDHLVATMAFCEAYEVTHDFTMRRAAQQAIDWAVKAQNPGLGLRYGVRTGRNDTSVTGWFVLALKAGRSAGLYVPDEAFAGALAWFDRATNAAGETGYETPGGGSSALQPNVGLYEAVPTNTAVAVVCRLFAGQRRSDDAVRQGLKSLRASPPTWSARTANFYYWYYATYAMFHGSKDPVRDDHWKDWNAAMRKALFGSQRTGGCEDGSWDPQGEWCLAAGRVYGVAMNALTLEIYFRFKRQEGNDRVADRGH